MGSPRGIVLFAHGSRDARWREPVEAVARRVRQLEDGALVQCAYLEAATPDLPTAVATLAGQGAQEVDVLPVFLGVGKHLREDLPRLMDDLRQAHPGMQLRLRPAIGETPDFIDALARLALKN